MVNEKTSAESITLALDYLTLATNYLVRQGVSRDAVEQILQQYPLAADTDGFITLQSDEYLKLINALIALADMPALGILLGKEYDITAHGSLGQFVLCSSNTWEAISASIKYTMLRNKLIHMSWEKQQDLAVLSFHTHVQDAALKRYVMEVAMSTMNRMLRLCLKAAGCSGVGMHMYFSYPQPDYNTVYEKELAAQLHFDQVACKITLPAQACFFPLGCANPALFQLIEKQCESLLQEYNRKHEDKVAQIRHLLLSNPGSFPNQNTMAETLHMAPRTLRKHLSQQNTSYQKILEEVKCELAKTYLQEAGWSIEVVAHMLGYSDRYHFSSAFKKWTGITPVAYRKQLFRD